MGGPAAALSLTARTGKKAVTSHSSSNAVLVICTSLWMATDMRQDSQRKKINWGTYSSLMMDSSIGGFTATWISWLLILLNGRPEKSCCPAGLGANQKAQRLEHTLLAFRTLMGRWCLSFSGDRKSTRLNSSH